jgi:hypothetical protein
VFNNNRKIVFFEETAHSLAYGRGSVRMPVKARLRLLDPPAALSLEVLGAAPKETGPETDAAAKA